MAEELKPRVVWEPPPYFRGDVLEILTAWYNKYNEIPTDRLAGSIIMAKNRWEANGNKATVGQWLELIEKSPDLAKIKDPYRRMGRLIQMVSLHI